MTNETEEISFTVEEANENLRLIFNMLNSHTDPDMIHHHLSMTFTEDEVKELLRMHGKDSDIDTEGITDESIGWMRLLNRSVSGNSDFNNHEEFTELSKKVDEIKGILGIEDLELIEAEV